jgi:hypothetical protein
MSGGGSRGGFAAHFEPDGGGVLSAPRDSLLAGASSYQVFVEEIAGKTFNRGAYRGHDAASAAQARQLVVAAFPEIAESVSQPFGYDWLGRQFALDGNRTDGDEPLVLLCQPGTGHVLNIPATLASFHEEVLVEQPEEAFEASLFAAWSRANADALPLARDACVGYRVPLFVGGEHAVENLEVTDIEVYWDVVGQLRNNVCDLPPGTKIGEITIGR